LALDPDRIADQLGIGAHQLVAFLLPSAYLFRTVFARLFASHPTASARHPLRVSAWLSRINLDRADYRWLRVRERPRFPNLTALIVTCFQLW
jgi:hypothetical protein